MVGVAVSINEMKRRHEKIVRVMELQTRLLPQYMAHDLTALGHLILEVGTGMTCRLASQTTDWTGYKTLAATYV